MQLTIAHTPAQLFVTEMCIQRQVQYKKLIHVSSLSTVVKLGILHAKYQSGSCNTSHATIFGVLIRISEAVRKGL